MSDSDPTYWFQFDAGAPIGPFTQAQFLQQHGRVPIGNVRYCPVGENGWRPLASHPDFAPPPATSFEPPLITPPPPLLPGPPPSFVRPVPPSSGGPPSWLPSVIGIAFALLALYLVYEWQRELTPREVVERFGRCKIVEDGKKYCTSDFYPVLVTLEQLNANSPDDDDEDFELTDQGAGQGMEYLVGFRSTVFEPTVARRVPMTGFITCRKSGSWKIADMSFTSYDGQNAPEPVSLLKNHTLLLEDLRKNRPLLGTSTKPASSTSPNINDRRTQVGMLALIWGFIKAGGAKSVGVVVLALVAGAFGWKQMKRNSSG